MVMIRLRQGFRQTAARADRHGLTPDSPARAASIPNQYESELTLSFWAVVPMASQAW
jgi:hypothetical protein